MGQLFLDGMSKVNSNEEIAYSSFRAVQACCSMSDNYDEYFISLGVLRLIKELIAAKKLDSHTKILIKALNTVNMLMASTDQIRKEVKDSGILKLYLNYLGENMDNKVIFEIFDAFRMFIFSASSDDILGFVDENVGFLDLVLRNMRKKNFKKQNIICLLILNKILGLEEIKGKDKKYFDLVLESEFLDNLEMLQGHDDEEVYSLASKLIDEYFEFE
jgi:hypothetical protein